jgi:hypothetical protein
VNQSLALVNHLSILAVSDSNPFLTHPTIPPTPAVTSPTILSIVLLIVSGALDMLSIYDDNPLDIESIKLLNDFIILDIISGSLAT